MCPSMWRVHDAHMGVGCSHSASTTRWPSQKPDISLRNGCISQVHVARDQEGRKLAVKVQHETLSDTFSADIATIDVLVRMVHWAFPDLNYTWLVEQAQDYLPKAGGSLKPCLSAPTPMGVMHHHLPLPLFEQCPSISPWLASRRCPTAFHVAFHRSWNVNDHLQEHVACGLLAVARLSGENWGGLQSFPYLDPSLCNLQSVHHRVPACKEEWGRTPMQDWGCFLSLTR